MGLLGEVQGPPRPFGPRARAFVSSDCQHFLLESRLVATRRHRMTVEMFTQEVVIQSRVCVWMKGQNT